MKRNFLLLISTVAVLTGFCQAPPVPYGAIPSPRQLRWQETDMYSIICLNMATFADKEWCYGDDPASLVNPTQFDASQIVGAAKAGGMKGVVIVAKHHDGFCLWPTQTTDYNISKSPWKNGRGDMIREFELACKKLDIKLGLYCSPWDRNNALYGRPAYVTDIFRKQLRELYANYGELFMSWFDGANGGTGYYGGARELREIDRATYYKWDSTFAFTRAMQPMACLFADAGPDVRWVGNEEGHAGETCWATYSVPRNGLVNTAGGTTGTRNGTFWMPAECDVPLRPGWFYHPSEDGRSKSPYALLDLYYKSVGRGACLDLGLAPDKRGLITDEDLGILRQFKALLDKTFSINLARHARFRASNVRGNSQALFGTRFLVDGDRYSYWATDEGVTNPELFVNLHAPVTFNVIRLRENIRLGQRIDSIAVDDWSGGNWKVIASATSIGANRLIRLANNITSSKLRIRIFSPVCIAVSDFGLFREPAHPVAPVIARDRAGLVNIRTEAPVGAIRYTIDGTEPGIVSPAYKEPFPMPEGGMIRARSFDGVETSPVSSHVFGYSKRGWKVISARPDAGRYESIIDEDPYTVFSPPAKDSLGLFKGDSVDIDMGAIREIKAFTYFPRQDKQLEGIADRYIFYTSKDGVQWEEAASGEFSNIKSNPIEQVIKLKEPLMARYFRFAGMDIVKGNSLSIAELGIR